jgi:hypothetical protein
MDEEKFQWQAVMAYSLAVILISQELLITSTHREEHHAKKKLKKNRQLLGQFEIQYERLNIFLISLIDAASLYGLGN